MSWSVIIAASSPLYPMRCNAASPSSRAAVTLRRSVSGPSASSMEFDMSGLRHAVWQLLLQDIADLGEQLFRLGTRLGVFAHVQPGQRLHQPEHHEGDDD